MDRPSKSDMTPEEHKKAIKDEMRVFFDDLTELIIKHRDKVCIAAMTGSMGIAMNIGFRSSATDAIVRATGELTEEMFEELAEKFYKRYNMLVH